MDYLKNIDKLYSNSGFFDRYGGDIFLTIFLIIIFIIAIMYFYTLNHLQSIRANWNKEKCNPLYFPYVPIINPNKNVSPMKQIKDHMDMCAREGVKDIAKEANTIEKYTKKLNIFQNLLNDVNGSINIFYIIINNLRGFLKYILNIFINILKNVFIALGVYFLKVKDVLNKMVGTMAFSIYILLEIFNIGSAVVINSAAITAVTTYTPTIANFVIAFVVALVLLFLGNIPFTAWLFKPISKWFFFNYLIPALLLLIFIGLIVALLIKLQNKIISTTVTSSLKKLRSLEPGDHRVVQPEPDKI